MIKTFILTLLAMALITGCDQVKGDPTLSTVPSTNNPHLIVDGYRNPGTHSLDY